MKISWVFIFCLGREEIFLWPLLNKMAAQLFPEANTETAFTKLPYKTEKGKKRGAGDLRFEFTLPVTLRRCSVRRTTQTALFGSNLLCNRHLARSKLQSISHPDTMYSNIHYIHAYTPVINLISLRFNLPFQFYVQLDAPASSFKAPAACSFGTVCKIYEHFLKMGILTASSSRTAVVRRKLYFITLWMRFQELLLKLLHSLKKHSCETSYFLTIRERFTTEVSRLFAKRARFLRLGLGLGEVKMFCQPIGLTLFELFE